MKTDLKSVQLGDLQLQISRQFETSPEILFDFLTCPDNLSQWFAPSDSLETKVYSLELKVGGRFRIAMIDSELNREHIVTGEYLEISKPTRLVFTWHWETETEPEMSRVSIELLPAGNGVKLNLCHDRFADQESCQKHADGWIGCLSRLSNKIDNG